jgi:hypothetical protein
MWERRRLTTLWVSTACCRDSLTFTFNIQYMYTYEGTSWEASQWVVFCTSLSISKLIVISAVWYLRGVLKRRFGLRTAISYRGSQLSLLLLISASQTFRFPPVWPDFLVPMSVCSPPTKKRPQVQVPLFTQQTIRDRNHPHISRF